MVTIEKRAASGPIAPTGIAGGAPGSGTRRDHRGARTKEALMSKLTDTQLVILSAAANRADGAVLPPPKSLKAKGGVLTKTLNALLKRGFIEERPASRSATAWRDDEDGARMMLVIAEAGLQAINGAPAGKKSADTSPPMKITEKPKKPRTTSAPAKGSKDSRSAPAAPAGSKTALLIDLLRQKDGTGLDQIVAATGWQAHSVRGAISGTLKKKMGLKVVSEKIDGRGRVYRIVSTAEAA